MISKTDIRNLFKVNVKVKGCLINFQLTDIPSKETIYDLLKKFKLNNKKVAIEHNGIIILKVNYKKKFLKDRDELEVVHFIGGG